MSKKLIYFVLVLAFCLVSSVQAANIIWVSDGYDELVDNKPDDHGWVDVLEAQGHTVDYTLSASFGDGYWRTLDADKIAALNAADLVIVSRCSGSGNYDDDDEPTQWNSVTTPLILINVYIARSSRWLWFNSTALTGDGGTPTFQAVDPSHPVFYGVELDSKNQVDIFDQTVGTGTVSFFNFIDVGNGTLIATPADQEETAIAEWEPGVEFYSGAGQTPAGRRMLFCAGTREGVGFGRGEYNLNAEGEKLFLNAVNYMLGTLQRLKAYSPGPTDGIIYEDTWANLSWSAGDTAFSHDVYLGENFDDVNDGAESTFQANQATTSFIVGFPGFSYPDGLVPGTTYYWRIDEVEEDGSTKHKGDVWSFTVPPKIAWNPDPPDGAKFIDTNADLSWSLGWGAKLHTMYFGDNFDDVNDAAVGLPQAVTTYDPGALEIGKVYYWRVDEFDGFTTHKGEVWSFTTTIPGGGVRGQYYRGTDLTGSAVLNRIDPEIDFDWADGSPDSLLQADSFSVRWTGELEVPFSETYTFFTNTDDGARLRVNDQLIINVWTDRRSPTEAKGTIDLTGGQQYPIVMEYYESGGNAVAQLSWESSSTPKQLVAQAALSPPVRACGSNPPNGATGVKQTATLSWTPGEHAASHEVYFGTDEEAVRNANTGSPEYKGTKALGSESYDPGKLVWDTPYYWRVDEVNNINPESPWVGNVWSFRVADFIVIDDFEDYNDYPPDEIFSTWLDGWEVPENGSTAGYPDPNFDQGEHFVETNIVHGGSQSMPYFYDNNFKYSEATMTLVSVRDWTEEGVGVLSLWFYGDASNAAERMYVALNGSAVVYNDNPDAALIDTWTEWRIDLQEFAAQGVNLANVNTISIGFGDKNNLQAGGSGLVFFDDIRLYRPAPEAGI